MNLAEFVRDFAAAMEAADALKPEALGRRSKAPFQPGIGPHAEDAAVKLTLDQLRRLYPGRYVLRTSVKYQDARQKCDLTVGEPPEWAIEVKMARLSGDNGKPDDTSVQQILSPFDCDRSAVSDALKLASAAIAPRKGVLIYGFDDERRPLLELIQAFEALAARAVDLGPRCTAPLAGLVHPVFRSGAVFAWPVEPRLEPNPAGGER